MIEFVSILAAGHTDEVSRAFRNRGMLQENWLFISIAIVVGVVWLALFLWEKIQLQRKATADTPQGLFYDLCKTHRLNRTDTNSLFKVASENYADQPAMIFIDPGILNDYIGEAGSDRKYYETLAERLF
ncbi:hypothetical protein V144x_03850 [Gimesia aquarii]|uniref:Uncharacterized protein n=2 Tax=Gimesia aquarii TaxID=2527964 RepID=A0A517VPK2_9PLAN|nr:hypothetical protein V144x_03850 [Gimesia aquarii]